MARTLTYRSYNKLLKPWKASERKHAYGIKGRLTQFLPSSALGPGKLEIKIQVTTDAVGIIAATCCIATTHISASSSRKRIIPENFSMDQDSEMLKRSLRYLPNIRMCSISGTGFLGD